MKKIPVSALLVASLALGTQAFSKGFQVDVSALTFRTTATKITTDGGESVTNKSSSFGILHDSPEGSDLTFKAYLDTSTPSTIWVTPWQKTVGGGWLITPEIELGVSLKYHNNEDTAADKSEKHDSAYALQGYLLHDLAFSEKYHLESAGALGFGRDSKSEKEPDPSIVTKENFTATSLSLRLETGLAMEMGPNFTQIIKLGMTGDALSHDPAKLLERKTNYFLAIAYRFLS